jgi:hypothetical protein
MVQGVHDRFLLIHNTLWSSLLRQRQSCHKGVQLASHRSYIYLFYQTVSWVAGQIDFKVMLIFFRLVKWVWKEETILSHHFILWEITLKAGSSVTNDLWLQCHNKNMVVKPSRARSVMWVLLSSWW